MYQKPSPIKITWMALTAGLTCFAVVLQFSISIPAYLEAGRTIGGSIVQLFSYFTILSNILVAASLTVLLLNPAAFLGRFFSRVSVTTAIAVYITIVGLVYNLVLRQIWDPKGLFKLADELLHLIVPVLYLIYWIVFVPKVGLKWKQLFNWLIFPFIYLIYIIIRGAISGYYPYPFMDVAKLGYIKVGLSSLMVLLAIVFFSALFILTGGFVKKKIP